ncbi:hypothetical protein AB0C74_39695 [Spirillospora sp. NPDC048832]
MSWQTDDGAHEGWAPAVWADGWISVGSGVGGALVLPVGPDGRTVHDGPDTFRDGWTADGWRGHCTCGWRGQMWERVSDPAEHDVTARRIYDGDPVLIDGKPVDVQRWGTAPAEVEEAVYAEWDAHVRPLGALDVVRAEANAVAEAQIRLADAVQAARAEGSSWAEIGRAAGMTRQSAHERWGRSR